MAIIKKLKDLISKDKKNGSKNKARHVAITTDGVITWSKDHKKDLKEAYQRANLVVKSTIKTQIKNRIPVITIYLLPVGTRDLELFSIKVDAFVELFKELKDYEFIKEHKVKISAFGKWYDLPARVVEPLKEVLEATKDYDDFFVNFCINYNGQDEIVDACKILSMQVKTEKIEHSAITTDSLKENTYSSDFMPPDLIIKNGLKQKTTGILLWDSSNSSIYFSKRLWPDFGKDDFEKAVYDFESNRI